MPLIIPLFLGSAAIAAAAGVALDLGNKVITTPSATVDNAVHTVSNTVIYTAVALGALYFIVNRKQ